MAWTLSDQTGLPSPAGTADAPLLGMATAPLAIFFNPLLEGSLDLVPFAAVAVIVDEYGRKPEGEPCQDDCHDQGHQQPLAAECRNFPGRNLRLIEMADVSFPF